MRPHRPNPSVAARGTAARKTAHVKQETPAEAKARKRAEAEDRRVDYVRRCAADPAVRELSRRARNAKKKATK